MVAWRDPRGGRRVMLPRTHLASDVRMGWKEEWGKIYQETYKQNKKNQSNKGQKRTRKLIEEREEEVE